MTLKHKGEFEIESGLGLPRLTTEARLAYTPPETGYQVFDTDLGVVATWNSTEWVLFDLDTKIDVVDGVGVNSLSLGNTVDNPILSMTVGPAGEDFVSEAPGGLDPSSLSTLLSSRSLAGEDGLLFSDNDLRIVRNEARSNSTAVRWLVRGSEDLQKTGGVWYWETVGFGTDGTPESYFADNNTGIMLGIARTTGTLGHTNNSIDTVLPNSMFAYTVGGHGWRTTSIGTRQVVDNRGGLDGLTAPNFTVRHLLNLETGEYFTASNDGEFVLIVNGLDVSLAHTPLVGLVFRSGVLLNVSEDTIDYPVPSGASALAQNSAQAVVVPEEITNISTTDSFLSIGIEASTALAFNADGLFASSVVHGSDGEASNSLVTKGYVDGRLSEDFTRNFVASEWVVGAAGVDNQLVISSSEHGLDFTAAATNYTVEVFQLNGELLQTVSIQSATNQTTGDVVLFTTGAPFDGRVVIT